MILSIGKNIIVQNESGTLFAFYNVIFHNVLYNFIACVNSVRIILVVYIIVKFIKIKFYVKCLHLCCGCYDITKFSIYITRGCDKIYCASLLTLSESISLSLYYFNKIGIINGVVH